MWFRFRSCMFNNQHAVYNHISMKALLECQLIIEEVIRLKLYKGCILLDNQ